MDAAREGTEVRKGRFGGLHAEAKAALAYSGNTLSTVRERYREAYRQELGRLQDLRDRLQEMEFDARPNFAGRIGLAGRNGPGGLDLAEHDAADLQLADIRTEVEHLAGDLGSIETELHRLDVAQQTIENSWLFLERGDGSLIVGDAGAQMTTDVQLRIVEAQEHERARLAQEVHDGPAQALTNAIFQVEYIDRVLETDPTLAQAELRFLRQLLRRELGDVRTFISQLRPRALDQLGLEGSIRETANDMSALLGVPIEVDLQATGDRLNDAEQTVVLRLVQEALQNVRKHARPTHVLVSSRIEGDGWVLEVRDDGQGFDVAAVASRGRRNFGLQFMRERAGLIGARFEVRSRPDGGTVVWLAIPLREER